jgi:multiple sugar transport system substrate-binding protein
MRISRRDLLRTSAGLAIGAAGSRLLGGTRAYAEDMSFTPEDGATLRVLRWSKFVQGDEDLWNANTKKFTEATGVPVKLEAESWEDIRPKAAVAANVGSGPDIIFGWYDDPHLYPEKLVPVTDLAEYLGNKYGGWYDAPKRYGMRGSEWIALPLGAAGARMVYRKSMVNDAGYDEFPTDPDKILDIAKKLHANGHPMGMALGHAVGDGNGWTHTVLWGFGGKMVDEDNNVVINSKETIAALNWVKELYQYWVPGTLSWNDSNNNKVFLAGDLSATNNGISIYYAALKSDDPKVHALADDIYHQDMPIGPVGKPTELHLCTQGMIFKYSKYPNAAKEYLRFMMEKPQYEAWQAASLGYVSHPLDAYKDNSVWHDDPKAVPYRDAVKNMLWNGYSGQLGYSSAAAMADYIVVDMFASVCSGDATPEDAAAKAEKRSNRFYKV